MARSTIEERLAKLEEQKRQLEEQERALRARMSEGRRKIETRQRILLGAFLHYQLGRNDPSVQAIRAFVARELPGFLTKPRDREVMAEVLDALGSGHPKPHAPSRSDVSETGPSSEGPEGYSGHYGG